MSGRQAAILSGIIVAYALGVTALAIYAHVAFGIVGVIVFVYLCAVFSMDRGER